MNELLLLSVSIRNRATLGGVDLDLALPKHPKVLQDAAERIAAALVEVYVQAMPPSPMLSHILDSYQVRGLLEKTLDDDYAQLIRHKLLAHFFDYLPKLHVRLNGAVNVVFFDTKEGLTGLRCYQGAQEAPLKEWSAIISVWGVADVYFVLKRHLARVVAMAAGIEISHE